MIPFLRYGRFLIPRRGYCTLLLVIFVLSAGLMSCLSHYYYKHYGTKWEAEAKTEEAVTDTNSFALELLPHLSKHPSSLKPVFQMKGTRTDVDLVIGITTTHTDTELYILVTLMNLSDAMTVKEKEKTLIVVLIADLVMKQARPLVNLLALVFSEQINSGLVEIVVPSPYYYPDLATISSNPKDPSNLVKRRTKQNLDILYLMAYARTRGTYYLSLRDDITVKYRFIQHIMEFIKVTNIKNPNWYVLEFCNIKGVGKLFRTSNLIQFMTYIQIFYKNMPIEWLLDSYIAASSCPLDRASNTCVQNKMKKKPKYKTSLFNHIGLYSSKEGKVHLLKHENYDDDALFIPHVNPAVDRVYTDIPIYEKYTLLKAYDGENYFWGKKPKTANVVEFWFKEPTDIVRYTFRTGNILHQREIFYNAVVEALPVKKDKFILVGSFNEDGFVRGNLKFGPLVAIRIRVTEDSNEAIVIAEIDFLTLEEAKSRQRKVTVKN